MQTAFAKTNSKVLALRYQRAAAPRRPVACRAEGGEGEKTVFFGGKAYTETEWAQSGGKINVSAEPAAPAAPAVAQVSFGDVMNFSGAAPETVNGRLAMLGFLAAVGAEFATDESVLKQWSAEPTGIIVTFLLVIAGSLITIQQRKEGKVSLGPFTPSAELLNGRVAMLGFALLLGIEAVKGSAFF